MKNADFEGIVETSDEWIVQRTGIRQRHIAGDGETTASLGEAAARAALANAGLTPDDIDLIVLATSTPDNTFPATAVEIQNRLGMRHGFAFDMQAVCSGFVYAMTTADLYHPRRPGQARAGDRRRDLLAHPRLERPHDLRAVRRRRRRARAGGRGERRAAIADRGVLASSLRSDGAHKDKLYVDGGPSTTGTVGHLRMEGREVFKHAVGMITDVIEDVFAQAGITADDLDWFVPHQANKRIIDASAKKLGIADEKVVMTVQLHGNTSAASMPLALVGRRRRRPHQEGRPRSARGDGRRLHLGRCPAALVANEISPAGRTATLRFCLSPGQGSVLDLVGSIP